MARSVDDDGVRQLVAGGAGRRVGGQDRTDVVDGSYEAARGVAGPQGLGERRHRLPPGLLGHAICHPAVGEHVDVAFGDRDVDQHPGPTRGAVEPARPERAGRRLARPRPARRGRDQAVAEEARGDERREGERGLDGEYNGGSSVEEAVLATVKATWTEHKRIIFDGDGYSDEWHVEAESRGLPNLRTTPDALPALIDPGVEAIFEKFNVLSARELESRYEVLAEQYTTNVNIEGETAEAIARTMLLPAATRHLAQLKAAGVEELIGETEELIKEFIFAIRKLESANEEHPEGEVIEGAKYVRDAVLPAMESVREVADKLEAVVADDLWPLPKYSEILFVK